jgi:hypothetical protein
MNRHHLNPKIIGFSLLQNVASSVFLLNVVFDFLISSCRDSILTFDSMITGTPQCWNVDPLASGVWTANRLAVAVLQLGGYRLLLAFAARTGAQPGQVPYT